MKKLISIAAALGVFAFVGVALADTVGPINFESTGYNLGNINGQNGWSKTGSFDSAVSNSLGTTGFGSQSLRISNAVTSGSFGDQTFAPVVSVPAGESSVAPNNHFEAQFAISSTMLAVQPGLALSVSPDNGEGARMSYLSFVDEAGGVRVTFYDVTDAGPLGTVAQFNPTDLGLLTRSAPHTIKFVMDFVDGKGNDVVKIYIDGSLAHTGTSWEGYYRFDPEQSGSGNHLSPVDTLIFRAGGTAAPSTIGNGYFFDNVQLMSSTLHLQPTNANECKKGGWEGYGFKNQGQCVRYIETGKDSR